jgi:hypothetical protein
MNLTLGAIGLGLLVGWWVCHFLGIFATLRACAAFVGTCLIAGAATGALGFDIVIKAVTWVEGWISDLTYALVHVRAGGLVLLIIFGAIFLYDLHPKHNAGKRTGFAGIALALVLIVGVAQIPALNGVPSDVRTGVSNAQTATQGG